MILHFTSIYASVPFLNGDVTMAKGGREEKKLKKAVVKKNAAAASSKGSTVTPVLGAGKKKK